MSGTGESEVNVFHIGDNVCYPMHGVGVVESIEGKEILGELAQYYVLRFMTSRLTVLVPVKNADNVGLRHIISDSEWQGVIDYMKGEPCEESGNWNQRYRDNLAKLKRGRVYDVADVIMCLKARDAQRGLSAGDRKMLITARQVLCAELCAASGRDMEEMRALME